MAPPHNHGAHTQAQAKAPSQSTPDPDDANKPSEQPQKKQCVASRPVPDGLTKVAMPADGSCLFHSIAKALTHSTGKEILGIQTRAESLAHIHKHTDTYINLCDGLMPHDSKAPSFAAYIDHMQKHTAWGGYLEPTAAARYTTEASSSSQRKHPTKSCASTTAAKPRATSFCGIRAYTTTTYDQVTTSQKPSPPSEANPNKDFAAAHHPHTPCGAARPHTPRQHQPSQPRSLPAMALKPQQQQISTTSITSPVTCQQQRSTHREQHRGTTPCASESSAPPGGQQQQLPRKRQHSMPMPSVSLQDTPGDRRDTPTPAARNHAQSRLQPQNQAPHSMPPRGQDEGTLTRPRQSPQTSTRSPHTPQHQPGAPPAPRAPRNTGEERFITSTAPKPITPLHPTELTPTPPARLLQIIEAAFTAARSHHRPRTVAAEGGAKHGCAAWAIAAPSEAIQGEDTTPFMAELTAILLLTQSIHNLPHIGGSDTQHTIIIATDCKSAIDFLPGQEPTQRTRCWTQYHQQRLNLQRRRIHLILQWTPAHDRHPTWAPTHGDAATLRELNRRADTAASTALHSDLQRLHPWLITQQQAHNWAERALQWAQHVAQHWENHVSSTVPLDT